MKNEISTKRSFIALKSEINKQRVLILLIAAAILLLSVYVANIFHLLDEPLFSLVYYGNLNGIFYTVCAVIFYITVHRILAVILKRKQIFYFSPKSPKPLSIVKRAVIYSIILAFGLGISIYLNFTLKVVYELGERITGMQLLNNGVNYVLESVKILFAVSIIALVQEAFDSCFDTAIPLPVGGLVLFLTFGILEFIFNFSTFSPIYLIFSFVYGVIFLLADKRTYLTFGICVILYLL